MNNKISFIGNSDIFINSGNILSPENMNKLFCTFTYKEDLEETIMNINRHYSIMFNKVFILESKQSDELICTYNIEIGNNNNTLLPSTILVHRKKDTNTLYSINALNILIKQLNNGYLDIHFPINWSDYKNCILLNAGNDLRRLDTSINRIVNLSIK